MVRTVNQAQPVLQDNQDPMVKLVSRGLMDKMELQVSEDLPEAPALLVHSDLRDQLVPKDVRDQLEMPDHQDSRVLQGPRQLSVEILVLQESKVLSVHPAQPALPVKPDLRAAAEPQEPRDPREPQDSLVTPGQQDLQGFPVRRALRATEERRDREDSPGQMGRLGHQAPKDQVDQMVLRGPRALEVTPERQAPQASRAHKAPPVNVELQVHQEQPAAVESQELRDQMVR